MQPFLTFPTYWLCHRYSLLYLNTIHFFRIEEALELRLSLFYSVCLSRKLTDFLHLFFSVNHRTPARRSYSFNNLTFSSVASGGLHQCQSVSGLPTPKPKTLSFPVISPPFRLCPRFISSTTFVPPFTPIPKPTFPYFVSCVSCSVTNSTSSSGVANVTTFHPPSDLSHPPSLHFCIIYSLWLPFDFLRCIYVRSPFCSTLRTRAFAFRSHHSPRSPTLIAPSGCLTTTTTTTRPRRAFDWQRWLGDAIASFRVDSFEDFLGEFEGLAYDCALTDPQRVDVIVRYVEPSIRSKSCAIMSRTLPEAECSARKTCCGTTGGFSALVLSSFFLSIPSVSYAPPLAPSATDDDSELTSDIACLPLPSDISNRQSGRVRVGV
ncbi:hypothetical protein EDB84DRAFT_628651 [Lactarius hengduanensis]|nr:hypothetical protein EDB84DRAFT_628651 [Lactarius hengduanensis]